MVQFADVFISYSREDKDRVQDLAAKLRGAGVSIWIDQGGIDGAALWGESIVNALDNAKVLLLALTESAGRSHNVAKEVMLVSERKGHILPVMLEQTAIPPSLKYPLAGIQHVEFFRGDADQSLNSILRSLEGLGVTVARQQPIQVQHPENARPERAAPAPAASGTEAGFEPGAIAVLPFDNISPDPEADYFSDGLTEELIARLSLVSGIELVSRWASTQFKGRQQDIRAIGKELGARYIIGGSVRRFQDSVRVTVQLVDVVTNRQLWGNTYKGKLDDIFDIQEQVAQQIVEALKLKLTFSEKVSLTKRQTVNAQAYDLYLRGQEHLYRLTKRSNEYAIQLFEKAIELDPRYAAAYAGCSSAYGQMYHAFSQQDMYREKAQELSFKALMYDNNLSEAYRAMGLSYFLWGKYDEATASCQKAIDIDPDDFIARWTLGRICFSAGRLDMALEQFRQVAELKPGFYSGHLDVAQTLQRLGRTDEAHVAYDRLWEMMPNYLLQNPDDTRARMIYANGLAGMGRKDDALRECATVLELNPGDPMVLYNAACVSANAGDVEGALARLREAVATGFKNYTWLRNDPDFAPIREHPEFQKLLQNAPAGT